MADTRGGLCAATHSKLVPGIDVSGRDWVSSNRLAAVIGKDPTRRQGVVLQSINPLK